MKKKHKKILWNAVKKSRERKSPLTSSHCAILKARNKTFVGYNSKKSHPLQKKFGDNEKAIYLHAEVDAIRKGYRVEGDISGGNLYIARTRDDGSIGMSAPCEACQEAINHFHLNHVFFTTNHGFGKYE